MFRVLIAAAALGAAFPAAAQADKVDQAGDWWLMPSGDLRIDDELLLVDGAPKRQGNIATLPTFLMFREADSDGVIAIRVDARLDCAAKTRSGVLTRVYYADGRVENANAGFDPKPVDDGLLIYQYACLNNSSDMVHYGRRPRSEVTAEVFRANPKR